MLHAEPIYIEGKSGDIWVEIAFQYTDNFTEQINSYCNRINVVDGGTLVTGFKTALTRVMNQYARELGYLKEKDENLDGGNKALDTQSFLVGLLLAGILVHKTKF